MRPLILEFQEFPSDESPDYSTIEYNENLNLNIDNSTGLPAIEIVSMETETMTKADWEDTDSDKNGFNLVMVTETGTLKGFESSDSDQDISSIHALLETQTHTRDYMEVTDSDPR
jgi:hypothetical protein